MMGKFNFIQCDKFECLVYSSKQGCEDKNN